ncbi:hypothetical protein A9Q87_08555 [Flavobacteriales bacterium 34_180_T64]|nr:hypothetical protein A9Q87_08555 [Flavobacteriales bacterium 34_180_T64]
MWKEQLKFYDGLIDQCPNFECKGKKMIYTSANGYMFSLLNKVGEIGIRLPKTIGQQFMKDYNTGPYKSYGAVMKDYVLIPSNLYTNTKLLIDCLNESYTYVMTLPTK